MKRFLKLHHSFSYFLINLKGNLGILSRFSYLNGLVHANIFAAQGILFLRGASLGCACESIMSINDELSDIYAMGKSDTCCFQRFLCPGFITLIFSHLRKGLCYLFSMWQNIVIAARESLNGFSFNRLLLNLFSCQAQSTILSHEIRTSLFCISVIHGCVYMCVHISISMYTYFMCVFVGANAYNV